MATRWRTLPSYTVLVLHVAVLLAGSSAQNIDCPSSCSCLGMLVDCSKRGLISIPKDLPIWVEILELQHNGITNVPEDAFKGLHSLQKLDLSNNQIQYLNSSAFAPITQLQELKVQHNHLSEIPLVDPLPHLTILNLNHNEIFSITSLLFERYPKLLTLDLNNNRIVEILNGTFSEENVLVNLFLNNNKIVNIEEGSLDNLHHLEWLKLNKNKLSVIPKDLFAKLSSLKYLEMNRNSLHQIEGLSFKGLESLQVLKLKRNGIRNLSDAAFYGLNHIQHLHLDHNNLNRVTRGWLYGLSSLKELTLSHNSIYEIENGFDFCENLQELDLTHNQLQSIIKSAFEKLQNLQQLFLDHNMISYIEEGAFRSLAVLQVLSLNSNEISWTIEDTNGAFVGLQRLLKLSLAENQIKSIAKRAFAGLPRLRSLDLAHNPVTSIQEYSFANLKNLQELHFNSSSLLCDCSLRWFPGWLVSSNFHHVVVAKCRHPEWLKGKSILEARPEQFTCDDFPKPHIIEDPQTQIALKGENISLICKAASNSKSKTTFEWKKDNKPLTDAEIQNFENVLDSGITEHASLLHIRSIQDEDEGRYQCIISNQFGSVYSQKARITVNVFPTFTKTPVDVTVKGGSTARLECAARGHPPPEISWKKDGGDDFPAARERRMHVMPTDEVFFIVNVKPSDMGVYSCTAENTAGIIMANASLTVLETPTFVRPMEDKEAKAGETAVLECMASGSPKPKLTWLKDGGPLVATERHFFTADNQLLIIVQTQLSDSGEYTCEMSNTLGTERDTSVLTVLPATTTPGVNQSGEETTTTGIIIIAVVCCVVGTSLVWVIIIYQTRKRAEEYSTANSDEGTLPGVIGPYGPYTMCSDDYKGSAPHLYLDCDSEHSSKDSGTGDSAKRSSDELLPCSDKKHCRSLVLPHKGHRFACLIRGTSLGSMLTPQSDGLDSISQSSPSTQTTNSRRSSSSVSSQQRTPLLPTFHSSRGNTLLSGRGTANGTLQPPVTSVDIHRPLLVPASEVTRWACASPKRSLSAEVILRSNGSCESIITRAVNPSEYQGALTSQVDGFQNETVTTREPGYLTFPRCGSPAPSHTWSASSVRCNRIPHTDSQNEQGSLPALNEAIQSNQVDSTGFGSTTDLPPTNRHSAERLMSNGAVACQQVSQDTTRSHDQPSMTVNGSGV